jgi:hypothetical protein
MGAYVAGIHGAGVGEDEVIGDDSDRGGSIPFAG